MTTELEQKLQRTLGTGVTLERELGGGGMSRVFVAQDTLLNRPIVIKVLPPERAVGFGTERFQQEIQLSAKLQHPCIVPLLTTGVTEGSPYYTMPFVEGETLKAKMEREGPLQITEAIRILRDVASALAYANERGVVHRDLKPANIMISGGYALVVDFGIAKALTDSTNSKIGDSITVQGTVLGTPAYMAPEQVAGDPDLDHRADIYALGAVAYEMLTGRPPFTAPTSRQVLAAHVFELPEVVNRRRPDIPAHLASLVMRCLEKDPAGRPQNATEFLRALDAAPAITLEEARISVAADMPSIAVLPFANMSSDTENDYFSDGMTDEIINGLTHLRRLRVASRVSSFAFKGKEVDIKAIGAQLNVKGVLFGSVRKSGNRVRISAHLVNVADGYQIWAERFDRELADVFEIQDAIAAAIVKALELTLFGAESLIAGKRPTKNLDAYDLYLKGRFYWNQRGEGLRKGLEFFQLALELDPNYALAHVGVADSYNFLGYFDVLSPQQSFLKARSAVLKAIELDNGLAEAHAALAAVQMCYDWDWRAAELEFSRALELNPQYVHALVWFGLLRTSFRRFDEGRDLARRAVQADPLSGPAHAFMSYFLYVARQYDEAVTASNKAIAMNPDAFFPHQMLGMSSLALGRPDEAIAALQKAVALSVRGPWAVGSLAYAYGKSGRIAEAKALLAELLDRSSRGYVPWSRIALAYAGLGQTDDTLNCLEAACLAREPWSANLLIEKAWDELHFDPRFMALVKRLGLDGRGDEVAAA